MSVRNDPTIYNTNTTRDLGIYAQDSWAIDRLTVNVGVRFESFASRNNTYRSGGGLPAGRFVPARLFAETDVKPFWNDVAPRVSVVYDLFGDARTALKFSVNKYVKPFASSYGRRYHPIRTVGDTRDWFDCALDPAIHTTGVVQCATAAQLTAGGLSAAYLDTNGDNIAQDHEIGLLNNSAIFSGGIPTAGRRPDPDLQREYNVEWSAGLQHEIAPRVSVTVAYYRRVFYDIEGTDNILVANCDPRTASVGVNCGDWIPFTVTSPVDRSTFLVFNRDPATRGLTDNVDTTSTENRNFYNGFEVSLQARLQNGGTVVGGWTTHQHIQNTCDYENPNGTTLRELIDRSQRSLFGGRFCDQSAIGMPFRHDFKLFATYPLPGDFEISGALQSYSGNPREIRWSIPASMFPGGQRTQSTAVQLTEPGSSFFERWNQVDIAFRKIFRVSGYNLSGQADIYNLFNGNAVQTEIETVGSALGRPTSILQGRLLRLAVQFKW